jgi:hypothetical protein
MYAMIYAKSEQRRMRAVDEVTHVYTHTHMYAMNCSDDIFASV